MGKWRVFINLNIVSMYVLEYYNGNKLIESYKYPTKALCMWKKKQLLYNNTHTMGTFSISKIS